MPTQSFTFGPFELDMGRHTLVQNGRPIAIGHKGFLLLEALVRATGQVVGKTELMEAAWPDTTVEESNLSVQIAALRKLLGAASDGGEWIATVPRVGYRFNEGVNADDVGPTASAPPDASHRRPSIAVLPFINMSGDTEQEYLADGITEDIITALTRFRWFLVIARNSSFIFKGKAIDAKQVARELGVQYLLEGSVRKIDQRVRISAQLIDATSANHIWADRYDLELTDVFAIQDAIAERVAGSIEPELLKTEGVIAATRHTGNMTAWDLVRQGTWHFHHVTLEGHLKARALFQRACGLDAELPEAHIWLARVSAGIVAYAWVKNSKQAIDEGMDAALKAIHLDGRNPYSHYALAIVSAYGGVPEQAVAAAEKAVEISPSFALGPLVLGMAHLFCGRAPEAIEPLERGLKLNPHDPQNFVWLNLLALAHLFTGGADRALILGGKAMKIRPTWRPTFETLAACYASLDRLDDAKRMVDQMRRLEKPVGDALAPLRLSNLDWSNRMARLLRKADSSE
jgi:pentatricopeptide repeat protein